MISEERVRAIQQRYEALQQALSNPDELPREEYVNASKELAELAPVITQIETFVKINQEIAELSEIVEDLVIIGQDRQGFVECGPTLCLLSAFEVRLAEDAPGAGILGISLGSAGEEGIAVLPIGDS